MLGGGGEGGHPPGGGEGGQPPGALSGWTVWGVAWQLGLQPLVSTAVFWSLCAHLILL